MTTNDANNQGTRAAGGGRALRTELTDNELAYLRGQRLGRLGTVDREGRPQVNPVGFFLRADGSVDIGGWQMGKTRKWRNIAGNPYVSLVVDDVASVNPWKVRGVEIRGTAEQVEGPHDHGAGLSPELIRIRPYKIFGWGIEE
ncbi:PPOX class F420-dependent oxidoreductase [Actinacidiphila acidipaludis]|uniref:PPOX class F420-dependent oxidoreductase n=1 Tax=Actinacidiphila acidipaludis TaxID=2873382 RepID=A0ABS7Q5R4_9ACTN|nr:PPOX class F420-dependent oxidoreductase [Streptomyces acidipaludis]MBY8878442.1 PPOX class F420-dependent oxidoreductase [Streptomyces acidipaludis]